MYYDSGFLIGLKAFVAAIIGGLVSYPLTALGALAVGVVESFASFWSGALKDVIVFSLLIPVLLLRSFLLGHAEEEARGDRRMKPRTGIAPRSRRWSLRSRSRRLLLGKFGVSLLNDIGIGALVALGLVLLTGVGGATSFGQAAFVGIAAYATRLARPPCTALSPWLGLVFALALTGAGGAGDRRADAAPGRPLPAAVDHRLGAVDRAAVRQHRRPRPPHRALEHPAAPASPAGRWSTRARSTT